MKRNVTTFTLSAVITAIVLSAITVRLYPVNRDIKITVYGNEKCFHCGEIRQHLDKEGINYIYHDVELNGKYQEEMYSKLDNAGFKSAAILPVVDVNGQILMKPGIGAIKKALSGEKVTVSEKKKYRKPLWRPEKNKSNRLNFEILKKQLNDSDLIIYDDGAGSGRKLLDSLTEDHIPHTVKQLNKMNNAAFFDMSSRLAGLGYGNVILFPVAEYSGEMIMNPSLDDVKILILEMSPD